MKNKIDKIYIIECITIFAKIFTLIAIAICICLFANYASKDINKYRNQQDAKEIDAISKNKTSDDTIVYVDTKDIIYFTDEKINDGYYLIDNNILNNYMKNKNNKVFLKDKDNNIYKIDAEKIYSIKIINE
jgi:hypothetical protein